MTTPENASALKLTRQDVFEKISAEMRDEAKANLVRATVAMNDARAERNATIGYVLANRILTNAQVMELTGLSRQRCYQLKVAYIESTPRPEGTDSEPLF